MRFNGDDHELFCIITEKFPHRILFTFGDEAHTLEIKKWCADTFGQAYTKTVNEKIYSFHFIADYNASWDYWGDYLYFKNSDDMLLFKLTWG